LHLLQGKSFRGFVTYFLSLLYTYFFDGYGAGLTPPIGIFGILKKTGGSYQSTLLGITRKNEGTFGAVAQTLTPVCDNPPRF
jgi:hypothetical protein